MLRAQTNLDWFRETHEAACLHDGIDPTAPSVVFSESNPFLPELAKAQAAAASNPHGLCAVVL